VVADEFGDGGFPPGHGLQQLPQLLVNQLSRA
jgi:hypothetical protein